MKKYLPAIILGAAILGSLWMVFSSSGQSSGTSGADAVTVKDGKQYIEIIAKGGYLPRAITAQANMPTVLRVKTQNTFDCSLSFTIPSLGIRKILPQSGESEFEIPPQSPGKDLQGLCGMGMYSFNIDFK